MKPAKVILPEIWKKSHSHNSKGKRKFFRAWPMRDTFTNWDKKSRINKYTDESVILPNSEELKEEGHHTKFRKEKEASRQSQSTCGITLQEYFREAAFTLPNENEYHVAEQSILPYIQHNFLIQQADQDEFSEADNCKKTSNRVVFRPPWIQKGSFTKELRSSVGYSKQKMKTEQIEQIDPQFQRIAQYPSKKKVMTICRSKDKFLRMQQSFELKQSTDRHKHPLNHSTLKGKNSSRQLIQKIGLTTKQNKHYNIQTVTKSAIRLKIDIAGVRQKRVYKL